MQTASKPIQKRHVFFISDLDARGATHYHALYRDEAASAAHLLDTSITVGARRSPGRISTLWPITAHSESESADAPPVQITYEFLRWDDLARAQWPKSDRELAGLSFKALMLYLRSGAYGRLKQLCPGAARLLLWPTALLLLQWVLLPLLSVWAGLLGSRMSAGLGWVCFGLTAIAMGILVWHLQRRCRIPWLARLGIFTAQLARQQIPELDARLDQWAARIHAVLTRADADEILIVGHGIGSLIATRTLARLCSRIRPSVNRVTRRPALSFMTLGNSLPLLALLPNADFFRAEIATVANQPDLVWFDFSDPADLRACAGADLDSATTNRHALATNFAQMFAAERYRVLQHDPFQLNFQYLCAGDRPTDYNYFSITTGRQSLAARFASALE
jgi:hypothetical protein